MGSFKELWRRASPRTEAATQNKYNCAHCSAAHNARCKNRWLRISDLDALQLVTEYTLPSMSLLRRHRAGYPDDERTLAPAHEFGLSQAGQDVGTATSVVGVMIRARVFSV
jgi:hypothetical protein